MDIGIDWFDTERISTGKISIVSATTPHTSSSRGGIKLVIMYSTTEVIACIINYTMEYKSLCHYVTVQINLLCIVRCL